jgi:hypothetical protein
MSILKNVAFVPDIPNRVYIKEYKYGFDEDGFSKANSAALQEARQQMQEKVLSIWQDVVQLANMPDANAKYSQSVDGVEDAPIDFPEFKANAGLI